MLGPPNKPTIFINR